MLRNIWVISLLNIYRLPHHKILIYKWYICKGLTIHISNSYFCKQPETSKFFDQKIQDFCSKKFDNPIFFYILKLIFTLSSVVFDYWFTISTLQKSKFVLSFSSLFKSNNWNRWKSSDYVFCWYHPQFMIFPICGYNINFKVFSIYICTLLQRKNKSNWKGNFIEDDIGKNWYCVNSPNT